MSATLNQPQAAAVQPASSDKPGFAIFFTVSQQKQEVMAAMGLPCMPCAIEDDLSQYAGMDCAVVWAGDDGPAGPALKVNLARAGARVRGLCLDQLPKDANIDKWICSGYDKNELIRLVADTPYYDPPKGISEDSLAWAFAERHKNRLRFCHEFGAWFLWDGTRWRKEKTRMAFDLARDLCREFNMEGKPVLGKATTVNGMMQFAQADRAFVTDADEWDTDRYLLGTPGGTVDLRTGKLAPARQTDMITKQTKVAPALTSDCPRWRQFLDEATQGDVELQRFMQQVAGYALTGDTSEHALFFIYGPGGNGKSVFLNTLSNILGDYGTTAAMDTFTASRSEKHPTDLAMLRGARLVSVSETEEGRSWAESRIKQLTGGDKVSARFMRQDFFEYSPQFKLLIVGNHAPMLHSVDDAMRRRFNIIPFVHKPEQPDHDLENKLQEEYPAILRWALEGCLDWQGSGLIRPESVQAATTEYFDIQDMFGQWLAECCEDKGDSGLFTETRALYDSWADYARGNGEDPGDIRKFTPLLTKRGYVPIKKNGKRCIKGLALNRVEDHYDRYND